MSFLLYSINESSRFIDRLDIIVFSDLIGIRYALFGLFANLFIYLFISQFKLHVKDTGYDK